MTDSRQQFTPIIGAYQEIVKSCKQDQSQKYEKISTGLKKWRNKIQSNKDDQKVGVNADFSTFQYWKRPKLYLDSVIVHIHIILTNKINWPQYRRPSQYGHLQPVTLWADLPINVDWQPHQMFQAIQYLTKIIKLILLINPSCIIQQLGKSGDENSLNLLYNYGFDASIILIQYLQFLLAWSYFTNCHRASLVAYCEQSCVGLHYQKIMAGAYLPCDCLLISECIKVGVELN